jgi:hypothetical protein
MENFVLDRIAANDRRLDLKTFPALCRLTDSSKRSLWRNSQFAMVKGRSLRHRRLLAKMVKKKLLYGCIVQLGHDNVKI